MSVNAFPLTALQAEIHVERLRNDGHTADVVGNHGSFFAKTTSKLGVTVLHGVELSHKRQAKPLPRLLTPRTLGLTL